MTFTGGLVFGWAYEARQNFPMGVVKHSVSGWIVFVVGLGVFSIPATLPGRFGLRPVVLPGGDINLTCVKLG
ncbi:hypothetical protein C8N32_106117 [Rhodovulum imhoffii]|uniref:Uncharacterized protein n=1 Tax=Rhodovulum imhoffii TaxID=365340 RepID=A0A2T5BT60_9RHOB|nr:hypothetical protein [Rhodovulum imhoffii]MBK5933811.1 hypothetical protein [Rhodovulum imhoffii]PTN02544.1 hypothetical protein C8N32_106117 [Rhodovulum imhoffii]